LMDAVAGDDALSDSIVAGQLAAVERLRARNFEGTLLGFVAKALASPRVGVARVTADFWEQFDRAETLEEIRQYRPSAYKALPEAVRRSSISGFLPPTKGTPSATARGERAISFDRSATRRICMR